MSGLADEFFHLRAQFRRISRRLNKSFNTGNFDQMALDLSALDALAPRLDALSDSIKAHASGDVGAAVAAQKAADDAATAQALAAQASQDQQALDAAVSSLATHLAALEAILAPPAAPAS